MYLKIIGIIVVMVLIFGQMVLFSAEPTGAEKVQKVGELYRGALEFFNKKDYNGFLKQVEMAHAVLPEDEGLSFELARGYALTGQTEKVYKSLNRLVDMDLFYDIETDTAFDYLRKEKEFIQLMEKVAEKKKPLINSTEAFSLKEKDLIPEGIAYDPVDNVFFLSSLSKSKIVRVDANHNASDFVQSRQDGILPTLGMRVDSKRRILWVCTNFGYPRANLEKELFGTSGVFTYNLTTGKLIKKYMLPKEEKHFLNDVALVDDGTAYFSDSHVPAVYRIVPGSDKLELFVSLSSHIYPNGITYSPNTKKLFVACADALAVIDTTTRNVTLLKYSEKMFIQGCDGLYYYHNSLIGVQNSILPMRIIRMQLDSKEEKVTSLSVLDGNNPIYAIPTTGVIKGDEFYFIGRSQLDKFDKDGNVVPLDQLKETVVLKIHLK